MSQRVRIVTSFTYALVRTTAGALEAKLHNEGEYLGQDVWSTMVVIDIKGETVMMAWSEFKRKQRPADELELDVVAERIDSAKTVERFQACSPELSCHG